MFAVEVYAAVRRFLFLEGRSRREAAQVLGLSRETVQKICRFSLPPGNTRTLPILKPKLGAMLPAIDAILGADRTAPVKQRHTANWIFERRCDEQGFAGSYTVVRDNVRIGRAQCCETFVPRSHPPGHAQVDFGEAVGVIGGVRQKFHFFCMDLPHSDTCFVKEYPFETKEAFLGGHVASFAFFEGVPLSILYDNPKIAVAEICGDGKRERTRAVPGYRGGKGHPAIADIKTTEVETTATGTIGVAMTATAGTGAKTITIGRTVTSRIGVDLMTAEAAEAGVLSRVLPSSVIRAQS